MAYSGDAGASHYYSNSAMHASSYHSATLGSQFEAAVPTTSDRQECEDRADASAPIADGSGLQSDDVNLEMPGELCCTCLGTNKLLAMLSLLCML